MDTLKVCYEKELGVERAEVDEVFLATRTEFQMEFAAAMRFPGG